MNKFNNPLNNVKIASPCSQDWNAMIGTDRKRFCGDCKLNVYNLSDMTKKDAENLLANAEGRLCVRFYRRADGTVLTKDCPVGWARVKQRASKMAAAFASLFFGVVTSLGLMSLSNSSGEETVGALESYPSATPTPKKYPIMGKVVVKTPTPKPTPKEYPIMGEIAPVNTPKPKPTPKATPKKVDNWEMGEKAEPLMGAPVVSKN